jgi:hypothetical protein
MHRDQLQNINPNRLHGCHPLDLHGVFGDHPFHLISEKPKTVPETISSRLKTLEKILKDVSSIDFPAKDHFAGIHARAISPQLQAQYHDGTQLLH